MLITEYIIHEVIAGVAGLVALKSYEDHVRRSGEQVSHPIMKEMLAGFAAAEIDKLFETKGLDYLDREKVKTMAIQQAHHLAYEKYGSGGVYQGDYDQQNRGYDSQNQGEGQNDNNRSYNWNQNQEQEQQWGNRDDSSIPTHHRHHHHRHMEDD